MVELVKEAKHGLNTGSIRSHTGTAMGKWGGKGFCKSLL